jgi:hypothetical protein
LAWSEIGNDDLSGLPVNRLHGIPGQCPKLLVVGVEEHVRDWWIVALQERDGKVGYLRVLLVHIHKSEVPEVRKHHHELLCSS